MSVGVRLAFARVCVWVLALHVCVRSHSHAPTPHMGHAHAHGTTRTAPRARHHRHCSAAHNHFCAHRLTCNHGINHAQRQHTQGMAGYYTDPSAAWSQRHPFLLLPRLPRVLRVCSRRFFVGVFWLCWLGAVRPAAVGTRRTCMGRTLRCVLPAVNSVVLIVCLCSVCAVCCAVLCV